MRRHARATEVTVTLETRARRAHLTVHDNGRGFAAERVPDGRVGLVGMRERAELLRGSLRVRSTPGHGTTVGASIPLEDAPA